MEQDPHQLVQQLSQYQSQLDSGNLTPDEEQTISRNIRKIKIQIFLDGVREGTNDS